MLLLNNIIIEQILKTKLQTLSNVIMTSIINILNVSLEKYISL